MRGCLLVALPAMSSGQCPCQCPCLSTRVSFHKALLTSVSLQVLVQAGASALFSLLRKSFQAALNASTGTPGVMQSLVSASWDLLCRIIHEGGARAMSMTVR